MHEADALKKVAEEREAAVMKREEVLRVQEDAAGERGQTIGERELALKAAEEELARKETELQVQPRCLDALSYEFGLLSAVLLSTYTRTSVPLFIPLPRSKHIIGHRQFLGIVDPWGYVDIFMAPRCLPEPSPCSTPSIVQEGEFVCCRCQRGALPSAIFPKLRVEFSALVAGADRGGQGPPSSFCHFSCRGQGP